MKKMKHKKYSDEAQEKQDEIFRQMSADQKIKLASDFSLFIMKLHGLNK